MENILTVSRKNYYICIRKNNRNMSKERLNPLNDYLFMKYMGEEGDEEQLISFLNAVLQKTDKGTIEAVKIRENRTLSTEIIGDKSCVLDLRAVLDDGSKVNIEVQLRDVHNMDKRSLFYWGQEYTESISSGENYIKMPNVITVNILGTEFLDLDEVHASFHLREDIHNEYKLTDVLEMHFIDMVKFRRLKQKDIVNNPLHRWLAFFDRNTSEKTIKNILKMDTAIKKAHDKIMYVSQDKEALHAYRMREMAIYDYNNGIYAAKEEGKEEGRKEGKEEGRKEGKEEGIAIGEARSEKKIIINLKRSGLSAKEIANIIDRTVEDVNKIIEEQGLA
jgi:predicted transposase/invertase (TIGR01784 family)